jgi:hypothetical protein
MSLICHSNVHAGLHLPIMVFAMMVVGSTVTVLLSVFCCHIANAILVLFKVVQNLESDDT